MGGSIDRYVALIYGIFKEGVTRPIFAQFQDGTYVVVKYMNNPQGQHVLMNEWVSYQIAKKVGLPILDAGICLLDNRAQFQYSDFELLFDANEEMTEKNYGYAFYSTYLPKAVPLTEGLLRKIDKIVLARLIIFDHIIYNTDRHSGNLLIQLKKEPQLFALDHSHVFKNQCIWDKYTFMQGIRSNDYLDTAICDANQEIYGQISRVTSLEESDVRSEIIRIQNDLTMKTIEDTIELVPKEWSEDVEEDLRYLSQYLLYRIQHLPDMLPLICLKGGK